MLPLDPAGAIFIFTHFIATRFQVDNPLFSLPVDFTAAVEIAGGVGIDLDPSGLGLRKTVDSFRCKRGAYRRAEKRGSKNMNTGHR